MGNLIKLHYLNNPSTDSLEEMPLGIGKLTSLRTMCKFVVGNEIGSGLRQLKSLIHLQGTLCNSRLENVKEVSDAKEAQLNGKGNLKDLLLEWNNSTSNIREPETDTRVLDLLKPHQSLKKLKINGYGGTKFPIWLGNSSMSNLVNLRIKDCSMCASLPSIGQLPFLKYLFIRRIARVKSVGSEFYGNGCSAPFPSLETLCFQDIQEWEKWIPHGSGKSDEGLADLRELSLVSCSKLQRTLPEYLPSLETLVIRKCEQLLVSILSLPTLRNLTVNGCKEVVGKGNQPQLIKFSGSLGLIKSSNRRAIQARATQIGEIGN